MKVYFKVAGIHEFDIPEGLETDVLGAIKAGEITFTNDLFEFIEGRGHDCHWVADVEAEEETGELWVEEESKDGSGSEVIFDNTVPKTIYKEWVGYQEKRREADNALIKSVLGWLRAVYGTGATVLSPGNNTNEQIQGHDVFQLHIEVGENSHTPTSYMEQPIVINDGEERIWMNSQSLMDIACLLHSDQERAKKEGCDAHRDPELDYFVHYNDEPEED